MQILITRPLSDSEELAVKIKELGHIPVINPLLEINDILNIDTQHDKTYLITSKHALPTIDNKETILLITGTNTYELALSQGYKNATYIGQDITELKTSLGKYKQDIIYLSGSDVTDDLCEFQNITRLIVYKATPLMTASPQLIDFLKHKESKAALFFSTRTAEIFINIINKYRLQEQSYAIINYVLSAKIANHLQSHGFETCYIAPEPNLESLIGIIDKPK